MTLSASSSLKGNPSEMMQNILTVDLEDWYVVENLKGNITFKEWEKLPARVIETTDRLLGLFDYFGVRATFFVLGWIAKRHPHLINHIASHGHEISCHSYQHGRIDLLNEKEFRDDTHQAVRAIEDACGITPIGYRAPSWSINSRVSWAFDVLAEMGFLYDSSIYPVKHDIYGDPDGPKNIFKMKLGNGRYLFEIPASTVRVFGRNYPVGGGGYLRHSPFWFTELMIKKLNKAGHPAIIYMHPWELDEDQPRPKGLSLFQRYRQYGSIMTLQKKIELILQRFDFTSANDYIRTSMKKPIGFDR